MQQAHREPSVFVVMPFDEKFDDIYQLGIRTACVDAGVHCERIDEQIFVEDILRRVYDQIAKADIIIAEMTGRNPNVFYETGYAHALNKRVILLTESADDIPFDLKHYPHIVYGGRITSLRSQLAAKLRWCIENPAESARFVKIDERTFLNEIDLSNVRRLWMLGHTGRKLYDAVHERLEQTLQKGGAFPEEIRILIRTPLVEGLFRNNYIHSTLVKVKALRLKGKNIDVRFYESVPATRGIICEFQSNERISFTSSYYWPQSNLSKAFDSAYVTRDSLSAPAKEVRLLASWMDQYWGRDEIHTVVFDFDDTLVFTGELQVKAWAQVVSEFLSRGILRPENLARGLGPLVDPATRPLRENPALLEAIRGIFIDKQLAEVIVKDLFVDVKDETIKQINQRRFEIRESMMDQARLFDGVEKLLDKLQARYNFAIISSTDEELISNYLSGKGLLKYFPVILGKKDPSLRTERENIYHKATLLIKLSEIIGMPLSRLVYIGDNNSDYLATRQIGIHFIEARQAARLIGKESLVGAIDPGKPAPVHFDSFEDNQLPALLSQYSQNISRSKYEL